MYTLITFLMLAGFSAAQFSGFNNFRKPTRDSLPPAYNNPVANVKTFQEFKTVTGRTYGSQAEEKLRERLFLAKKSIVVKHTKEYNDRRVQFELALNQFSDRKLEEFLNGLTGRRRNTNGNDISHLYRTNKTISNDKIPESFDWRQVGGVTPAKFQGLECGACWAFAVTGAIEGHLFRKTGKLIPLSEQNLVDCAYNFGNEGCEGGFQEYGFAYVFENHGIANEKLYPYCDQQEDCMYKESKKAAEIDGYVTIPEGDEDEMKKVVGTLGPIACSVNAGPDSFQLYKTGIYMDDACNEGEVNHSVLIVGYGTENGQDYWIVKNSWTDQWGENGFMKLPRNAKSYCGIASECSYPII